MLSLRFTVGRLQEQLGRRMPSSKAKEFSFTASASASSWQHGAVDGARALGPFPITWAYHHDMSKHII